MAKTVLIAEDYEDTRVMMMALIQLYGHKVIAAEDGYDAVEKTRQYSPELILMDLAMPGMDGVTATEIIRKTEGFAHTPIIALTAYGELRGQEALKAGCDALISKPMDFDQLGPLLNKYLSSNGTSNGAEDRN
jgi:CheY-like chemotaxis protein